MTISLSKQPSWDDFLRERHRREDEGVAKKYTRYVYLGRGHFRTDICRVQEY